MTPLARLQGRGLQRVVGPGPGGKDVGDDEQQRDECQSRGIAEPIANGGITKGEYLP